MKAKTNKTPLYIMSTDTKRYTPENITELFEDEIIVFGSNNLGKHYGGLAAVCVERFGAIEGCPIGLQGQSYGVVTTSFTEDKITLPIIENQILVLYQFAVLRPDLTFYCSKIGCGIAGFTVEQIKILFPKYKPDNIILPIEFSTK